MAAVTRVVRAWRAISWASDHGAPRRSRRRAPSAQRRATSGSSRVRHARRCGPRRRPASGPERAGDGGVRRRPARPRGRPGPAAAPRTQPPSARRRTGPGRTDGPPPAGPAAGAGWNSANATSVEAGDGERVSRRSPGRAPPGAARRAPANTATRIPVTIAHPIVRLMSRSISYSRYRRTAIPIAIGSRPIAATLALPTTSLAAGEKISRTPLVSCRTTMMSTIQPIHLSWRRSTPFDRRRRTIIDRPADSISARTSVYPYFSMAAPKSRNGRTGSGMGSSNASASDVIRIPISTTTTPCRMFTGRQRGDGSCPSGSRRSSRGKRRPISRYHDAAPIQVTSARPAAGAGSVRDQPSNAAAANPPDIARPESEQQPSDPTGRQADHDQRADDPERPGGCCGGQQTHRPELISRRAKRGERQDDAGNRQPEGHGEQERRPDRDGAPDRRSRGRHARITPARWTAGWRRLPSGG